MAGYTEDTRLTLKNLYRVLTKRDYPDFSYRVFPDAALQGETVTRFWGALFREGLPEGTELRMFTQAEGRSRNLRRLLNGGGSPRLMEDWYAALAAQLDSGCFLRLISAWMGQLDRRRYVPRALSLRLEHFIRALDFSPGAEGREQTAFFRRLCEEMDAPEKSGAPLLFIHAALLSWLTLYALFLGRSREGALERLRLSRDMSLAALCLRRRRQPEAAQPQVISTRQSVLCVQPLAPQAYFGYRTELGEAVRLMERTGKLAVTGIGGAGKTEFVRQLLMRLSGLYRRLAFVQYAGSLEAGYAAAFPRLAGLDKVLRVRQAWALLEAPDAGRTLLLIDGADAPPAADPDLNDLGAYGCDVILSSRFLTPEGFACLCLSGLDADSAVALFLHNDPNAAEDP